MAKECLKHFDKWCLASHTLGLKRSHHEQFNEMIIWDFSKIYLSVDYIPLSDFELVKHQLLKLEMFC